MIYFDYPAGSDTQTTCAVPGAIMNTANCDSANSDLTDVGSYTGSASPNGTFDQGGNVWEWNEAIVFNSTRGFRGGGRANDPSDLAASKRAQLAPNFEFNVIGFRVASVPNGWVPPPFQQGIPALGPIALFLVAAGLLGFGAYRRGRA